jgi:hypothetical protein
VHQTGDTDLAQTARHNNEVVRITTATAGALAAAALGLAGAAAAAPTGGSSAADTIASLQAEGYNVQLSGSQTAPPASVDRCFTAVQLRRILISLAINVSCHRFERAEQRLRGPGYRRCW